MPQPQGTTSRADLLSAALDQSEAGTLATVPDAPAIEADAAATSTAAATAQAVARDQLGRFAPKTEPEAADPNADAVAQSMAAQAAPAVAAPAVAARKPPSSWSKDNWALWDKLATDPELAKLQDYIEKREGDFAKGVSTYKAQWDQAAPVFEAMAPFIPELQQHGIQPAQWISNLGNAHRTLALGSPEQKLQMFAQLATQYGVPLQALTAQEGGQPVQVDPQFRHLLSTTTQLQQRLQSLESGIKQQHATHAQREVEQFASTVDSELFEAAKPMMGQLLGTGMATDLKTAFEKAVRLDDSLWSQKLAKEQAQQAEAERAAQAEALKRQQTVAASKKAAAVSPKSASPTGAAMTSGGKKDRRALLEEAWSDSSGHV